MMTEDPVFGIENFTQELSSESIVGFIKNNPFMQKVIINITRDALDSRINKTYEYTRFYTDRAENLSPETLLMITEDVLFLEFILTQLQKNKKLFENDDSEEINRFWRQLKLIDYDEYEHEGLLFNISAKLFGRDFLRRYDEFVKKDAQRCK